MGTVQECRRPGAGARPPIIRQSKTSPPRLLKPGLGPPRRAQIIHRANANQQSENQQND